MEKLFEEALNEVLCSNAINESGMSTDIAKWEPLIFPLIKKIYPQSLVEQIASVQPTKSPMAKVSYLNAIYTGNDSNINNGIHWTNSRLMSLPPSAMNVIVADGVTMYAINTNPITYVQVFYGELSYKVVTTDSGTAGESPTTSVSASVPAYWNILAACVTGTLSVSGNDYPLNPIVNVTAGNTITNPSLSASSTVLYTTTNRSTIKKVFTQYSNVLEDNSNLLEIDFETATKIIETTSRKIKSQFTLEQLTDLKNIYNEKAYDLVSDTMGNEVRQEIDREIIQYLKTIATPMATDINFPLSLGMQSGLDAITYDAIGSVFLASEEIVRATKRNRTMFVLADSQTCAFLLLNPFHTEAKPEDSNPYKVGTIGSFNLYCDPYSTEHYIIVGYDFKSQDKHDAGLYFVPYTTSIHEVQSGKATGNFTTNFMIMNRYGYTVHPQDTGTGNGDSDFFRIFSVNFTYSGTTIPNFPQQFQTDF